MSQHWLCCEGRQRRNGLTSIVMSQGSWFWKEAGRRKGFSTLIGQMNANVKLVTRGRYRKAQAISLPKLERSQTSHQGFQKVGTKSEDVEERMEVAKRYGYAPSKRKSMEQGHLSMNKWESAGKWECEKHKSRSLPAEGIKKKAMLLQMALFWAWQESGEHVVVQWHNWIMMKNWDHCTGCMALWMPNLNEVLRTIKRAELTAFFFASS